jgi:hypothetical protein
VQARQHTVCVSHTDPDRRRACRKSKGNGMSVIREFADNLRKIADATQDNKQNRRMRQYADRLLKLENELPADELRQFEAEWENEMREHARKFIPETIRFLLEVARDEKTSPDVRCEAIEALRKHGLLSRRTKRLVQ